jgi:hypothetical protein
MVLSGALLPLALVMQAPSAAMKGPKAIAPESLYGEWISDCVPVGQNGRHGLVVRLAIAPDQFESRGQMYARNSCDVPVIAATYAAEIREVRGGPEQLQLELKLLSATMTIEAEDVAALYRQGANCGLKDWRRDVPMPVDGKTCEPLAFPAKGAQVVQDVRISGDRLILNPLPWFSRGADASPGVILPVSMTFHRKRD